MPRVTKFNWSAGLVDVHTHIADSAFDPDRSEVLSRAAAAGIVAVVAVAETLDDARRNLELGERHPAVLPAAGLHPTVLDMEQAEAMEDFIRAHRQRLVAIGEVGLDYWQVQDEPGRELQRDIFARFVLLSLELDLPLSVHSRSAGRRTIELLLELGARRVVMHAFDGRFSTAKPGVETEFLFSVPPSVVRSPQKQKLVKHLPLRSILLETDSPVLAPVRDDRNEPANALIALDAVAELKGVEVDEVRRAVLTNQERLFGTGM